MILLPRLGMGFSGYCSGEWVSRRVPFKEAGRFAPGVLCGLTVGASSTILLFAACVILMDLY